MKFTAFRIKNFKGIQNCTISLDRAKPGVFTLIGLNESGKTTILEAINYFIAGDATLQKMYAIEVASVDKTIFVPKSKKSNFNGTISIAADLVIEGGDVDAVEEAFKAQGYKLDRDRLPASITVTQNFHFKNSDFEDDNRTWSVSFYAKRKGARSSQEVGGDHECWRAYHATLHQRIPQICYFPTFLFELPDKIYLDRIEEETDVNAYYRQLIQDILDSLHEGLNVQQHIVDRIRTSDGSWSWFSFLQTDRREQVNHVLLKASAKITRVVIESWKRVFNRSFDNKRIELEYGHDQAKDAIYVKFFLIDGSEKYEIGNRSLGFRWFFCFWLFTHFRRLRSGTSGIVFLLDEPASNLHARAQEELLGNIEGLAGSDSIVIYSTHSHYLINPRWLDSAYIISNGEISASGIEDEFVHDSTTNIKATKYRTFVGKHPNQRSYFLPVLDALEYKPSELTIERPAILVEGKADFAFLKIVWRGHSIKFSIIPGNGAKSLDPLIGILTGWGFDHVVLLDDDKEGREALSRYKAAWGIDGQKIRTLRSFDAGFANKSLEEILSEDLGDQIRNHFGVKEISKSLVQSYLYEHLASDTSIKLTSRLAALAEGVKVWCESKLFG
jgi:predicted ATPase